MIETALGFAAIVCPECAMIFKVPKNFYELRRRDGETFFCPVGHRQHFGENEITLLKKQLAQALSSKAFHQDRSDHYRVNMIKEQNRSRGLKSALTLTKKRIAKGKCPCCTKTFSDLENHLKEKHAEYLKHIEK